MLKEKQILERQLDSCKSFLKDTQTRNDELCENLKYLSERKQSELEEQYKDGMDKMMCKINDVSRKLNKYQNISETESLTRKDYNRLDDHEKSWVLTSVPFFIKKKAVTDKVCANASGDKANLGKSEKKCEENSDMGNVGFYGLGMGSGEKMIIESEWNGMGGSQKIPNDIGLGYYANVDSAQKKNNTDSSYHNKMMSFLNLNTKKTFSQPQNPGNVETQ